MATEYLYEDCLLRAADAVIEQFSRNTLGSLRIPLAWMAVEVGQTKHERVRVEIGVTSNPRGPVYSPPAFRNAAFNLDLPASEEGRLRAFLDEAARSVGR